jgi:hypothetical protein
MQAPRLTLHTGKFQRANDRTLVLTQSLTWAEWRAAYVAQTCHELAPWGWPDRTAYADTMFYWRAINEETPGKARRWFGVSSPAVFDDVLATGGAEELTAPVRRALAELRAVTHAPRVGRHVAGAWDIPAVVAGQPLPALARTRQPAPPREVEITVDITFEHTPGALAALAARVAHACRAYSLERGALRASVVWVVASYTRGCEAETRARYLGSVRIPGLRKQYADNAVTLERARRGVQTDLWRARYEELGAPAFNQICHRTRVYFDPTNLQEVAAVLSPTVLRMHITGSQPESHVMNNYCAPPELRRFDPRAYLITLDADRPEATNASMCEALGDC